MPTIHAYGEHPHQFAQLHRPPGIERPPVAVIVHGGFWMTANGNVDRMIPMCEALNAQGWAAWNVEYRRLGENGNGGWPQSGHDVSAAIDLLATLDDPVDLRRVVSIGHSAGGHLTLLDAARRGRPFPLTATAGQAPVTDMVAAHALGGPGAAIIESFMGGTPTDLPAAYADASPVRRVPLRVPQLIVQGAQDDRVPSRLVEEYAAAATAAGDDVSFELRPADGHFDHLDPDAGAWAVVAGWLERW